MIDNTSLLPPNEQKWSQILLKADPGSAILRFGRVLSQRMHSSDQGVEPCTKVQTI